MVTFEDIKKANESIRTTDIKGKEYAEVNQRIKAFRMVYPTGMIETNMLSNENGVCVFMASVGYYEGDSYRHLATGTAFEKESSSFINKTSFIENCETSAVGRALGMAGFGIDTSVASYEEVQNAINNQEKPVVSKTASKSREARIGALTSFAGMNDIDEVWLCSLYGKLRFENLDDKEIDNILGFKEQVVEKWKGAKK